MPWFEVADRAIEQCTQALAARPDDTKAYLFRGEAQRMNGDVDAAIADFARVVELTPPDTDDRRALAILVEAHICLGATFGKQADHDRANEEFTRAIALNPDRALAWYCRGVSWTQKHQSARAIADYTRAIELNPDDCDAWLRRGLEYKYGNEPKKARADFARVKALKRTARESKGTAERDA